MDQIDEMVKLLTLIKYGQFEILRSSEFVMNGSEELLFRAEGFTIEDYLISGFSSSVTTKAPSGRYYTATVGNNGRVISIQQVKKTQKTHTEFEPVVA